MTDMELKAMTVLNVLQMGSYDNVLVYFKSEADKVIADKMNLWNKWLARWLELAEKFKPNSTAQ